MSCKHLQVLFDSLYVTADSRHELSMLKVGRVLLCHIHRYMIYLTVYVNNTCIIFVMDTLEGSFDFLYEKSDARR